MLFKSIKSWNTPTICFAMEALIISNFPSFFNMMGLHDSYVNHGYSRGKKSCDHQLRLVVEIYHYLQGFFTHPRWLVGDFWTINSIKVIMMMFVYFWQILAIFCRICCKELLLPLGRCPMRCMPNLIQLVALPERQDVGNATHSTRNLQNMLSAIFQYLLL